MTRFDHLSLEEETRELLRLSGDMLDRPHDTQHTREHAEKLANAVSELCLDGTLAAVSIDLLHIVAELEHRLADCELKGIS